MRHKKELLVFFLMIIILGCSNSKKKIIIDPDFTKNDIGKRTSEYAYKGSQSLLLSQSSKYAFGNTRIEVNSGDRVLGKVFGKNECSSFNLYASSSWGKYYTGMYIDNCESSKWNEINLLIKVPDSITNGYIQFYTFYYGKDSAYIDYLTVDKRSEPFYQDSLPKHVAYALTNELLKELNVNGFFPSDDNFISLVNKSECKKVFKYFEIPIGTYMKHIDANPSILDKVRQSIEHNKISPTKMAARVEHNTIAGYTNNIVYEAGEDILISVVNNIGQYSAELFKFGNNYEEIKQTKIGRFNSNNFVLNSKDLDKGLYGVKLIHQIDTFNIPIIINESNNNSSIVVLAPITTWHAYNGYYGKSFYRNHIDSDPVYYLSTKRPLKSANFDSTFLGHDLYIFDNIYKYYSSKANTIVYPDYYLEKFPEKFDGVKTVVLAQHCEYFSPKMFLKLEELCETKNVISLGGNQCYYKVIWSENFTKVECRKDGTWHDNTIMPGGTWASSLTTEARLLGVRYSDAGYGTYMPYKITNDEHWMFHGLESIKKGHIFGESGIDNRGISGDETDKIDQSTPENAVVIAKGTNPNDGGGEIVIIEKDSIATLATGSIASGAGLIKDSTFTKIMDNFLEKYN